MRGTVVGEGDKSVMESWDVQGKKGGVAQMIWVKGPKKGEELDLKREES